MPLIHHTYGKGRVRVMRVHRADGRDAVRDVSVQVMLEGDFAESWTHGDNRRVVATDTIRNVVNVVASETLAAENEIFGEAVARRLLDRYKQIGAATVTLHETRWLRAVIAGAAHPHTFLRDGNGQPTATVAMARSGAAAVTSGVAGYTFMKSTQSGWEDYVFDAMTTLPPTADRIAATAMDADWTWRAAPPGYAAANARVLESMLAVFGGTYSKGIQDSLFRMGEAALAAVPELATLRMACPNQHYIPVDLARLGIDAPQAVFMATEEPHGQIECTVGR